MTKIIAENEKYYVEECVGEYDQQLYKLYSKKVGFVRMAYSKSFIVNNVK